MILYVENLKDATIKLLQLIINLVKLQDGKLMHRNLLHSHTQATKNKKEILRKQSYLSLQQK